MLLQGYHKLEEAVALGPEDVTPRTRYIDVNGPCDVQTFTTEGERFISEIAAVAVGHEYSNNSPAAEVRHLESQRKPQGGSNKRSRSSR